VTIVQSYIETSRLLEYSPTLRRLGHCSAGVLNSEQHYATAQKCTDQTQMMYLFAQNRVRKYLGAVAARPRAGFVGVISRGGPNLVLTRVVTAPNQPPRYVIGSECRLEELGLT